MSDFKGRHFNGTVILWAVRWYCKYGVRYRELAEMLDERGIQVNHTRVYRWVQKYAPEIERRLRGYWKPGWSSSWQINETYIKVKGRWMYLYRAITQQRSIPIKIKPTGQVKKEGMCEEDVEDRQVKYLNNRIESDHVKLKRLIKPVPGFQSKKTKRFTMKSNETACIATTAFLIVILMPT